MNCVFVVEIYQKTAKSVNMSNEKGQRFVLSE